MWIVLAWLGCDADPESEPDPCRPGFSLGPDGHCYPPPPRYPDPTVADALENLPACMAREPGDAIDFGAGCVDARCADDRFDAFVVSFGEPSACPTIDTLGQQYECAFGEGRFAVFVSDAGLERPDPEARAAYLRIRGAFEGADPDGLGVGVAPSCFVDELGLPDTVEFERASGVLTVSELRWDVTGPGAALVIRDVENGGGGGPDGEIDNLFLLPR
ncbi:MAG: hypothetical protein AAF211_12500 [Myxococcota bacterium]